MVGMETNTIATEDVVAKNFSESKRPGLKRPAPRTLWRRMASPFYAFSAAPWVAFAALVVSVVITFVVMSGTATIVLLLLIPALAVPYGVFERKRLEMLGYSQLKDGHVKLSDAGLVEWVKFRYTETATWREVASLAITFVFGAIMFMVLLMELALLAVLAGMSIGLLHGESLTNWGVLETNGDVWVGGLANSSGSMLYQMPDITSNMWWIFVAAFLFSMLIFAYLNGVLAASHASASRAVLDTRPEEYERQVARLSESRTKIVDAFESERRRIERDLHDGVQQELVNINLRLGLAEMEAKSLVQQGAPAQSVVEHVSEARVQLAHAQQTLRNTVRGIYPAVLEDHGLMAALEELSYNCAIPTRLTYAQGSRLSPETERTAYFAASEALTNALKHSNAREIQIDVRSHQGFLMLTVNDNGVGGANAALGTGLAGLAERAHSLGGSLNVVSPQGGPTQLQLQLPVG